MISKCLTKEEFISGWFEGSNVKPCDYDEAMLKLNMEAIPCECESKLCKGWIMSAIEIKEAEE